MSKGYHWFLTDHERYVKLIGQDLICNKCQTAYTDRTEELEKEIERLKDIEEDYHRTVIEWDKSCQENAELKAWKQSVHMQIEKIFKGERET